MTCVYEAYRVTCKGILRSPALRYQLYSFVPSDDRSRYITLKNSKIKVGEEALLVEQRFGTNHDGVPVVAPVARALYTLGSRMQVWSAGYPESDVFPRVGLYSQVRFKNEYMTVFAAIGKINFERSQLRNLEDTVLR